MHLNLFDERFGKFFIVKKGIKQGTKSSVLFKHKN